MLILLLILLPITGALLLPFARRSPSIQNAIVIALTVAELAIAICTFIFPQDTAVRIPLLGLSFLGNGFRAVYSLVCALMWLVTALFSPEYFKGHAHTARYYAFFLVTLGSTVGTFLSADLLTTFVFFEIMSLSSFVWVAQNETPEALRAGKIYLGVAIFGGMCALLGLMFLNSAIGTLEISEIYSAVTSCENEALLVTSASLLLVGFGAKAGMFPLHFWLPTAHPVAPAPASSLLSGALTKTGIFGVLIVTCEIMRESELWSTLLLILGMITMLIGALKAFVSVDIKRVLACSSVSQIGFILMGIGAVYHGEWNTAALSGVFIYMINHSLAKLILFLCAGALYTKFHTLDMNELCGKGRQNVLLHIAFLSGALTLTGTPMFCGYAGKTLIHEGIAHLAHHVGGIYHFAETVFLVGGGLTVAYMLKLYLKLFILSPAGEEKKRERFKLAPASSAALIICAVIPPVLGIFFDQTTQKLGNMCYNIVGAADVRSDIGLAELFSLTPILEYLLLLAIGVAVFFFILRPLTLKKDGTVHDPIPKLPSPTMAIAKPFLIVCHIISDLLDFIILLLRKTFFAPAKEDSHPTEKHISYELGAMLDRVREFSHHENRSYAHRMRRAAKALRKTAAEVISNLSFSLLMAFVGICAILIYLVFLMT